MIDWKTVSAGEEGKGGGKGAGEKEDQREWRDRLRRLSLWVRPCIHSIGTGLTRKPAGF